MPDVHEKDLARRRKEFALRIIRLYALLSNSPLAQILGKQVLRSGTSPGAQYREALRARSRAEFTSKIDSSLQELEETGYWLELLVESGIVSPTKNVRTPKRVQGIDRHICVNLDKKQKNPNNVTF